MPVEWPFAQMSREMASALYDHHHEGILMCDHEGRLVYYNQRMARLDNLDPDDVLGRHILDVYNLDRGDCMSTRCLDAEKPILNVALYYRATRGDLVNAICNAYPIFESGRFAV